MLCRACHRRLPGDGGACVSCGAPRPGAEPPLELVFGDGARVSLVAVTTIGRAVGNTVQIDDPSVSRHHARVVIRPQGGRAAIEDAGSSHGTYLDRRRVTTPLELDDGSVIRLGNQEIRVERRPTPQPIRGTIVVQPGMSLLLSAADPQPHVTDVLRGGYRPRIRSGYALRRLDADDDGLPWVARDLRSGGFLRLADADAELFLLLDGQRTLPDLVGEAEQRFGPDGAPRLARLLADLGERGMLADVAGTPAPEDPPATRRARLVRPREHLMPDVAGMIDALYARGGWILFTRPALVALAALSTGGVLVFAYLVAGRYGTPFVVASKIGLGGLIFLAGRTVLVALHETAHALALASLGRRVTRAGFKLVLIFPYAFVDTSEAWFESRRRRIAVSAAGPVSDVACGGLASLACLALQPGTLRDITFQLAFAAYAGAFFNLNPFLDRDGYHILVDVLREPGLRGRARAQLARRLSGGPRERDEPALTRYAAAGVAWSVAAAGFGIVMTLRYQPVMTEYAPSFVVWTVLATVWAALFVPVVVVVGPPLAARWRTARVA